MLKKSTKKRLPSTAVWGIRVPAIVKTRWLVHAAVLGVPIGQLVSFILNEWYEQNSKLFSNDEIREELAQRIAEFHVTLGARR